MKKKLRFITHKFSCDWSQIPTKLLFIPFYHINCFCNEITATLTFKILLFTVAMLMMKSETFGVRFPTK